MKLSFVILNILLVFQVSYAQTMKPKPVTNQITSHNWVNTSSLKKNEFSEFNYDTFRQQQDSLNLQKQIERFRNRLSSIDSLLAVNQSSNIDNISLAFSITYWENGSIDSFSISLYDDEKFSESQNFDGFVQELNLQHIQFVLSHAQKINRDVRNSSQMQIDYVNRQIEGIHADAGFNSTTYASGLLTFIHKLLADNKTKLGIASNTMYEDSFEPDNLTLNKKIIMREKFIRYVYSKLD